MSGRFPGSPDLRSFWDHLRTGTDLVSEVPREKWEMTSYFSEDREAVGKSYGKWMGYLSDVDKFDPLFFNLSPKEAEEMDPQQRLFLEESWSAIEDAGYAPSSLSEQLCGVFIGVGAPDYGSDQKGDYQELDAYTLMGNSSSILSARISYLLNLKGPALSIDTACSSSLVAIAQACDSLVLGRSALALAGGVCVLTTPRMHVMTSKAGMLSEEGKCYTFDDRANGFVPGEGVGVVMLKKLDEAIEAGDRIYGVIKGWGVNQDGATNGITAPSDRSQTQLQCSIYDNFGINPETISYVEAHGTGTKLGDPIEVKALKESFGGYTEKVNYCGLGSVKSNIGHTLTAAGVSGVMKVLLQLQHRQLVPTLHYEALNTHIDLEGSPFYINTKLKDWETEDDQPRRAAVSSFGFSGTNAHVVIEEYPEVSRIKNGSLKLEGPFIVPLSAKNEARLEEVVQNLSNYLDDPTKTEHFNLSDLAYTLQTGREAMESRLVLVVNDLAELKTQFASYRKGERKDLLIGDVKKDQSDFLLEGAAGRGYIEIAIKNKESKSLAQLWVKGVAIDWNLLYAEGHTPSKISLPTYPFARERYWLLESEEKIVLANGAAHRPLHPLLHENASDLSEQKYASVFSGKETFLSDHQVQDEKVLPGVAYLEMVREAGARSLHQSITQLKDITWLRPISVNGAAQLIQVSVFEAGEGLGYEVYSLPAVEKGMKGKEDEEVIHSQGQLSIGAQTPPAALDLSTIQNRLTSKKSGEECYMLFRELGLNYGITFQGIDTLYYGKEEALSKLSLPKEANVVLPPGLLDSALQTCLGLGFAIEEKTLSLPFSVKEVTLYGAVDAACWAYARRSDASSGDKVMKYDIDLLSEAGEVLLSFRDFVTLPVDGFQRKAQEAPQLHYYVPEWEAQEMFTSLPGASSDTLIVLSHGSVTLAEALTDRLACEVLAMEAPNEIAYYTQLQELVHSRLASKASIRMLVVYPNEEVARYGFIRGLLKTAQLEHPTFIGKTIGVERLSIQELDTLATLLESEQGDHAREVRYAGGKRQVRETSPREPTTTEDLPIKAGGVYWITGGAGGLGKLFAEHLAQTADSKLILTGRQEQSPLSKEALASLHATYHSCDVTDQRAVEELIKEVLATHGRLDGIIHSAGVIKDGFLLKKTPEEAEAVLLPKIKGVRHLDEATKELDLAFMVYCSSVAGVLGNVGQADYASANAFMDGFAHHRNALVREGKRSGKTLSINWPLWKEGGMQVDEESERYLERTWGMQGLPTEKGIEAFEALLQQDRAQGMVVYGRPSKLEQKLLRSAQHRDLSAKAPDVDGVDLQSEAEKVILQFASELLKLDISRLSTTKLLSDYGFDSMMMTRFANHVNGYYNIDLPPTAFFNYPTLEDLSVYLASDHAEALARRHVDGETAGDQPTFSQPLLADEGLTGLSRRKKRALAVPSIRPASSVSAVNDPIAIIGMSGRFSSADTEDQLWDVSIQGIRKAFIGDGDSGFVYGSVSHGTLKDEGLPLLAMDALQVAALSRQERMLFDSLSAAMLKYGITKQDLSSASTGVFIAAQQVYTHVNGGSENQTLAYLLPNKISHYLDLGGPSEVVNTYCTSVYVALHRAIQSIRIGECDQAIVGGVNVLSPEEMRIAENSMAYEDLLSRDGYTRSFCDDGNGFVRSEGAGIIIIQPLRAVQRDQHSILGLIRGSAVYHGGRGFSLSAPSAKGLKTAIGSSIEKSGVAVDTIDYIEAHGIANPMADAIELTAINGAYRRYAKRSDKKWYVGSVKPVVGHPELASGMASLIKVLKAFEHGIIPGIAGLGAVTKELPPNHSLILPGAAVVWERGSHPRRASLNSYAVGGVNAHIILEEADVHPVPQSSLPIERMSNTYDEGEKLEQEKIEFTTKEKSEREMALSTATFIYDEPYLRDHLVHGKQVILGVTYASLLADALPTPAKVGTGLGLSSLLFQHPVVLAEGDQAVIEVVAGPSGKVRVTAQLQGQSPVEVATGKQTEPGAAPPSVKEQLEMILNQAEHVFEKEALYSAEDQATIWHGASLRVMEAVHVHATHALGILKVDTSLLPEHTYSAVHPALLNGGLLTGLTLLEKRGGGSFLPLMIKEFRVYGEVGTSCYALAELVTSNREMLEVNYRLCNEEGAVLVEVLGFVCKRVLVNKSEDVTTGEVADQAHETLSIEVDIQLAEAFIREQLVGLISEDVSRVSSTRNFMDLGVDSSQLIALVRQLEARLDTELYPTLFFEHQNIAELSAYLIEAYPHAFRKEASPSKVTMGHSGVTNPVAVTPKKTPSPVRSALLTSPIAPLYFGPSNPQARAATPEKASSHPDPVAVIGMHGVFPGSRDKEAFWDHLYGQSDLVKEIPEDHFDYRPWYDTN
ncbi:MAG: SDR family NAD(P)-dependent oxidoreductase, partial [Verrucomicrobiota bacterium]